MAFITDENGNITLVQGDSGTLVIDGLDPDQNYTIYFAIQDKKRNPIGSELYVNSIQSSSVVFELTADFTELMTVPQNSETETYYFGIKQCTEDGAEDTLLIGDSEIGEYNTITVYPKKVEGF